MIKYVFEKIEKETKIKIDQIHIIRMVGNIVRSPIILESIKKAFWKEVS